MELEFKPDFESTQHKWDAFWRGESTGPLAGVVLPKEGVTPVPHPGYLEGRDGNFTPIIDQLLAYGETHHFLGSAIPFFLLEWGPDTFSSFLGADLIFVPTTSWCVPFVEDWDKTEIRFQRDSKWWRMTEDLIGAVRARCDGKLLINPPTLVANLDTLAALRGAEKLLFDLIEHPDAVKRALEQVCRAHTEVLEAYSELLDWDIYGSMNVSGFYSSGLQSRPQCDVSCMISPSMFHEFVMPCLAYETADTIASQYHLDGPGAIQHLPALGGLSRLDMIDYTPDPKEKPKDWLHVRKMIDNLGKGQTFGGLNKDEVQLVWKEYKSRKLVFFLSVSSKSEAEDILSELEQ
ncbi:MAG: uroporphyrinogen decarboxylase/cobalamine-independent methonine synthase family protein [Armatimonadota bacterium]